VPIDTQFGEWRRAFGPNPAHRSPTIESLFPPGVAAAELRTAGDPTLLEPKEAAAVSRAVPKRAQEFAAGRLCARSALARFGVTGFAVRVASDRRPLWPDPFVGSITHTTGFCAAVIAARSRFASLGIDTEIAGAVKAELWPSICLPAELGWIEALPQEERARAATLIFSAKEAFYKCQYPSTGQRLSFFDLRIVPLEWGAAQGVFAVEAQAPLALFAVPEPATRLLTAYRFHEEFVSAGVAISNP
jgi:4'-phosphopantetheinyl transferase EntD